MERCCTLSIIREMQTETTRDTVSHPPQDGWSESSKCWDGAGEVGLRPPSRFEEREASQTAGHGSTTQPGGPLLGVPTQKLAHACSRGPGVHTSLKLGTTPMFTNGLVHT